jgi:hypothetical protein
VGIVLGNPMRERLLALSNQCGTLKRFRLISAQLALALLAGCASSSGGPFIGIGTPSLKNATGATVTSLAFAALGGPAAQTIAVTQANYAGSFTVTSTSCSKVASVSPSAGTAFTITPIGAGSCGFTFASSNGGSTQLTIGVTTTSVTGG